MRTRGFVTIVALAAALLAPPATATAQTELETPQTPTWAPAATATIRPGVRMTAPGGCTTNFVFYEAHVDPAGGPTTFDVYIGVAAHCYSLGAANETNGCRTASRPLGTQTTITGASRPATLVYSSWLKMQEIGEADGNACAVNAFALVKLDPRDHAKVNPSVLHFGGPSAMRTTPTVLGDELYTYGNSSLRFGVKPILPKWGWSTGSTNSGWSHRVYTVTPGVPGDSGSGMMDAQGRAMGVVVTLAAAPFPASNGVTDMDHALNYMRTHTGTNTVLALGTEPFTPNRVPPTP